MRQLNLITKPPTDFGGSLLAGKRKTARTLAISKPLHLILKGDTQKSGSLLKHRKTIDAEVQKQAAKFDIKIFKYAIERTHIHFAAKLSSRENYKKFIRAITGRLAQLTKIKFTLRPYTKIIEWGRQLKNLFNYVLQNHKEATRQIAYKPRRPSIKPKKLRTKTINYVKNHTLQRKNQSESP